MPVFRLSIDAFSMQIPFFPKFFQLANLCGVHESYGLMQETAYERCF